MEEINYYRELFKEILEASGAFLRSYDVPVKTIETFTAAWNERLSKLDYKEKVSKGVCCKDMESGEHGAKEPGAKEHGCCKNSGALDYVYEYGKRPVIIVIQ